MNYYNLSSQDLGQGTSIKLLKLGDSGEVFYELALEMIKKIKENNLNNEKTVFIVPVGPVGQYPIFTRLVNRDKVSLKNTFFINMDEYLNEDFTYIEENSPLSFRGYMNREVYGKINGDLVMEKDHRIFPDPRQPETIRQLLKELGKVDIAFGGIGITGHLAFNEPQKLSVDEFKNLETRVIEIARETLVVNSIGSFGGAIELMPRFAVTLGMKEILSADKLVFGAFRDWHRSVVRRTLYGEITSDFPATMMQTHKDATLIINNNVAQKAY